MAKFEKHYLAAKKLIERAVQFDFVEAVAVAGSICTDFGTEQSDVDTYIYINRDITMLERDIIVGRNIKHRQIVDYWGASDFFNDMETGVEVDCMYFSTDFMKQQIDNVLINHQAQLGYSTAFWHTVKNSFVLYDKEGWFEQLQAQANQTYPDALVANIISLNFPILRQISTSYKQQIEKAISRNDLISINHRVAAFLASYFDIVFAVNKMLHLGEKQMMAFATQCKKQPQHMQEDIASLLQHSCQANHEILNDIDAIVDNLEVLLRAENLI